MPRSLHISKDQPVLDLFEHPEQSGMVAPDSTQPLTTRQPRTIRGMSLSRLLKERGDSFDPSNFDTVDEETIAFVQPQSLRDNLAGFNTAPHDDNNVFPFFVPHLKRRVNVALPPEAYKALLRNPRALGKSALTTTVSARQHSSNPQAAGQRAYGHSLKSKYDTMDGYVQNILSPRARLLGKFIVAAENPGLALFGKEDSLQMAFANVLGSLDDILSAVNTREGASDTEIRRRQLAVIKQLTVDRQKSRNIGYARGIFTLARDFNLLQQRIFKDRMDETIALAKERGIIS